MTSWFGRFLDDNELEKLSVLFSHYVSLGQFEAAKCSVRQLHARNASAASRALKQMILQGPTSWQPSKAAPAPCYVTWLSYVELCALSSSFSSVTLTTQSGSLTAARDSGVDVAEPQFAAFEMALRSCMELCSKEQGRVLEKLKEAWKASTSTLSSTSSPSSSSSSSSRVDLTKKFSVPELKVLREVLALFPLLGNFIIRPFHGQRKLYTEIILDLLSRNHLQEALSFVPFLQASSLTGQESKALDAVLEKLYATAKAKDAKKLEITAEPGVSSSASSSSTSSDNSMLLVYQALLGSEESEYAQLLERFGAIEDAAKRSELRDAVPSVYRTADEAEFWQQIHVVSSVSGKHLFEITMEKAITALEDKRFDDCRVILRMFPQLQLLIVAIFAKRLRGSLAQQTQLMSSVLSLSTESSGIWSSREAGLSSPLALYVRHLRWRVAAAAWVASQSCIGKSGDDALAALESEKVSLLELVGDKLPLVERAGLLDLLSETAEDQLLCMETFVLLDVARALRCDDDATVQTVEQSMRLVLASHPAACDRVGTKCIRAMTGSSNNVASLRAFRNVLRAIQSAITASASSSSCGIELKQLLKDAEFRVHVSEVLDAEHAPVSCFRSGTQLLFDAVLAEKWDLCAEIIAFFNVAGSNVDAVAFYERERQLAEIRNDLNAGHCTVYSKDAILRKQTVLCLADLAFSVKSPTESVALIDLACSIGAAEESEEDASLSSFLSRVAIVAKGLHVSVSDVFRLSRDLPSLERTEDADNADLKAFVRAEMRIRELSTRILEQPHAEPPVAELQTLLAVVAPKGGETQHALTKFLRYAVFLKRTVEPLRRGGAGLSFFSLLDEYPEDLVARLVSSGEAAGLDAARALCEALHVSLVDVIMARVTEPITLPELEVVATELPLIAAVAAVRRHPTTHVSLEMLDFAQLHVDAVSKEGRALLEVLDSCRTFASTLESDGVTCPVIGTEQQRIWSDFFKGVSEVTSTLSSSSSSLAFHRFLVQRLCDKRRFRDALRIASSFLPEGPSDDVLESLAAEGGSESWRYVVRISDPKRAARVALSVLSHLELENAIDVLEMSLHCKQPDLEALAARQLRLLRAYEPVLRHRSIFGPWHTWQELHAACEENCNVVVRQLLEWKQFELARTIADCFHQDPSTPGILSSLDIDADALLHLLEHGSDVESVSAFIDTFSNPVATVQMVLNALRKPEYRWMLWRYLKDRGTALSTTRLAEAERHELGARLITLLPNSFAVGSSGASSAAAVSLSNDGGGLRSNSRARRGLKFGSDDGSGEAGTGASSPSSTTSSSPAVSVTNASSVLTSSLVGPRKANNLRSELAHLEGSPRVLIEVLMMNERMSELSAIFKELPQLVDDEMILTYARRALAFDKAAQTSSSQSATPDLQQQQQQQPQQPQQPQVGLVVEDPQASAPAMLRMMMKKSSEETFSTSSSPRPSLSSASPMGRPASASALLLSSNPSVSSPSAGAEASVSSSSSSGLKWMLLGDELLDMAVRRQHVFTCAPSINLSTALFDLCSRPRLAGRACLDLASQLSLQMTGTPTSEHLLVLNLIKQLLFYAKLQFSKDLVEGVGPAGQQGSKKTGGAVDLASDASRWKVWDGGGAEAGVAVCQTFLAHVDLLHDLFLEDCGVQCSLEDLADPRRARSVRDFLIEQDRMKLAAAVATKCAIESEPVWMAWGLRLLRLGDYDAAKEKLNKCIERTLASSSIVVTDNLFDKSAMLAQILEILQADTDNVVGGDSQSLRDDLIAMESAVSDAEADADTFNFSQLKLLDRSGTVRRRKGLEPARYMQCMYYLSRLGSPTQLVRFWLSNDCLEDACRYVMTSGLPEGVFISEILTHCLSYGKMKELYACLPRIDPRGSKKQSYLVHACRYLNEAHAFDLLLELQEFMQDWTRAGLTCVKLFHIESNFMIRLEYLKMAKNHFTNAIKESQEMRMKKMHSSAGNASSNNNNNNVTGASSLPDGSSFPPEPDAAALDFEKRMPLTEAELNKYYRKVMMQISIMEFLEQRPNVAADEELRKLSMFGAAKDRIAERLVILSPSGDLGIRMIQEFRLAHTEIYSKAARELVLAKRKNDVSALLKSIKGTIEGDEWDQVLLAIIKAYAEDLKDNSSAEKFIERIFNPRNQVAAYRMVGLLKTAYVLAAKNGWVDEVSSIRTAALNVNSKTVIQLCNAYLSKGL